MRIGIDIHTVGKKQTGNETYITNLVRELADSKPGDIDYHLFYTKGDRLELQNTRQHEVRPHNPLVRIPFSFPYQLLKNKIDIAHFQYVVPPLTPCKTVVMVHDISYEHFPEYFSALSRKRMQILIPYSARKSAHVMTVSEYSKKQIVEKYEIAEDKISVTYPGASANFKKIADAGWIAQKTLRFNFDKPYILAVGNLQARKNIVHLIEVYADLIKKGQIDLDLVLVGQLHWKGNKIEQAIERLKLGGRVKITGYVADDELIAIYNNAHIFAFPSLFEGFGIPPIEAMKCEIPVICSNAACLPEVVGDAAIFIDPRSTMDLSQAILKLSGNNACRQDLIKKGIRRAAQFTWAATAEKTMSVYKRVA
jgi:glycosyltransferase involved in cell wall biosynthesis